MGVWTVAVVSMDSGGSVYGSVDSGGSVYGRVDSGSSVYGHVGVAVVSMVMWTVAVVSVVMWTVAVVSMVMWTVAVVSVVMWTVAVVSMGVWTVAVVSMGVWTVAILTKARVLHSGVDCLPSPVAWRCRVVRWAAGGRADNGVVIGGEEIKDRCQRRPRERIKQTRNISVIHASPSVAWRVFNARCIAGLGVSRAGIK